MSDKIIYVQDPDTLNVTAHMVDINKLSSFSGGGYDPNFRWCDDEAYNYVQAYNIPPVDVSIPRHIKRQFGL